jgi:predicted MFS family arabinose efflux permease
VLVVTAGIGAIAPNYPVLLVSRVIAGMAAGGVYPVAVALVGDLVPVTDRQVALGRYLAIVMSGNILSTVLAGAVGDLAGWRSVFVIIGCGGLAAFAVALLGLRHLANEAVGRLDISSVADAYRAIFANPRAKVCYIAVFAEGIAVLGVLPYVALLLAARGEARASITGLVVAAFAFGSIVYAVAVRRLLTKHSVRGVMQVGGWVSALALIGAAPALPWPFMLAMFVVLGFGFYMLHGSIQVQTTELAPTHRGAATALHSFFFSLGQGLGPVIYWGGLTYLGAPVVLSAGAVLIALTGSLTARALRLPVKRQ